MESPAKEPSPATANEAVQPDASGKSSRDLKRPSPEPNDELESIDITERDTTEPKDVAETGDAAEPINASESANVTKADNTTEREVTPERESAPKRENSVEAGSVPSTPRRQTGRLSVGGRNSYHRSRQPSIALSRASASDGTEIKSSAVLIRGAMETLSKSKEASRSPDLQAALKTVLEQFDANPDGLPSATVVMEPIRLVCAHQGGQNDTLVTALDCIGKLFTLGYLSTTAEDLVDQQTGEPVPGTSLVDKTIDIVCETFDGESTDARVELQIIKALTSAIVNDEEVVHGSVLLKAIRLIYNIFVVSTSSSNRAVAQVSLTQMVQIVFERVKNLQSSNLHNRSESYVTLKSPVDSSDTAVDKSDASSTTIPQLTLDEMRQSVEDEIVSDDLQNIATLDAFLIFRTFCKLSDKSNVGSGQHDLKSSAMHSKLLSLHLLHMTLKQHISVFSSKNIYVVFKKRKMRFADAIRSCLWSSLSTNAASISPAVFEISAEIFWLLLSNLRSYYKREIEVFFKEVYFTILDMKTATMHQKLFVLEIMNRLCNDPRALVELYLNYDCDAESSNVFENLLNLLVKFAITAIPMSQQAMTAYLADGKKHVTLYNLNATPSAAIMAIVASGAKLEPTYYPQEFSLKMRALESLVSVLRSLNMWYQRDDKQTGGHRRNQSSVYTAGTSEQQLSSQNLNASQGMVSGNNDNLPGDQDDPHQFENIKQSKKAIARCVSEFNYKPSGGIKKMVELKVIPALDPEALGKLLYEVSGLDLTKLGEYLGKDDAFNRNVLHFFVNEMNFRGVTFTEALRQLLQRFRLPGEGQVVDRYMLEFANKFVQDNPNVFSSAETPYVLGYSAMMLNTDLHSARLKTNRMSLDDFIANNRGINDGMSLPDDFLTQVYEDIANDEIKLVSEHEDALLKSDPTMERAGWLASRANPADAYALASELIASKTAKLFKGPPEKVSGSKYYRASHVEHIQPMFNDTWMSILAGLSGPFQQSNEEIISKLCLEGMSLATRIACHVGIDLARQSFVKAFIRFANLSNVNELLPKNVFAAESILRAALSEGNNLHDSWYDIILMTTQLERVELIAQGVVDELDAKAGTVLFTSAVSDAFRSGELAVLSDKLYTQSNALRGDAILDFVKALTDVCKEEVAGSKLSSQPRMFCLRKVVDVCYYNMNRIRMEWSKIWALMGDLFNNVCSHTNNEIVLFGLDSLRQLSMRFLDLDELPHFQFQKEFLRPFSFTLKHKSSAGAKLLVIDCLQQMVMVKHANLKSGWITIFTCLSEAFGQNQQLLNTSAALLTMIAKKYQDHILSQDEQVLSAYLSCLSGLSKQSDVKLALHAVEYLNALFRVNDDTKFWFTVCLHLQDIILNGEDLEVRGRALTDFLELFKREGDRFMPDDWTYICKSLFVPLFKVLDAKSAAATSDLDNIWMSTTLVQALRGIVDLFKLYFEKLHPNLDEFFLNLLETCIYQEVETVARIGSSCMIQLIVDNSPNFNNYHWRCVSGKFETLFTNLVAPELSSAYANRLDELRAQPIKIRTAIKKCIQQLLLLETVDETLASPKVFEHMPLDDCLRILKRVKKSYEFAHQFNGDQDLRTGLWQIGLMKELPNLLLQEKSSALVYFKNAFNVYENKQFHQGESSKQELLNELSELASKVIHDYNTIPDDEIRHIKALQPVLVDILNDVRNLNDESFSRFIIPLYLEIIDLLGKETPSQLREGIQATLRRVATAQVLKLSE